MYGVLNKRVRNKWRVAVEMRATNQVEKFGSVGLVGGLETYLPLLRNCTLATGRSVIIRNNRMSQGSWLQITPASTSFFSVRHLV
jgi:hypothetical protein